MTYLTHPMVDFLLARITERENEALEERDEGWPPGVLAACEADRNMIQWAMGIEELRDMGDEAAPLTPLGDTALRSMASVYADHPNFRDEWRQ
ncbi:DUF6221 family protein [Nocardioides sp. LHG3406-4]|uniref:DUF6221 family protein n=1 Tax=Nocardioides sp. LHG3406-4 TaxID=2804575 RepID=UPI003CEF3B48